MTAEECIEALKAKHAELDAVIQEERSRPLPDSTVVSSLKRQKLRIKDEISRLIEQ